MISLFLFLVTVLIWGTSWIAIAMQIGPVPVIASVFYRFAVAAILFFLVLMLTGRLQFPRKWRFVILQALCLFCFNFLCFYNATAYMPSGLVSVIFSMAAIFNALNAKIVFADQVQGRTIAAGLIGAFGLVLLFWQDLSGMPDLNVLKGIGWAAAGTFLFSLGNMMSRKNAQHGVTTLSANAWGMGVGAFVLLLIIGISGTPMVLPQSYSYLWALIYLAVAGSVIGFTTYLELVARIGSDRAAYATVVFPIVALGLSTLFEGYVWQGTGFAGLALILTGNMVMFAKAPSARYAVLWPRRRHH